ncbi:MAG: hypothetical protein ABIP63_07820 [Thermoanaerobaculia bacterium]
MPDRIHDDSHGSAADPRLRQYLGAGDGVAAEAELTGLICAALPIAEPIIARRIGRGASGADDFEDVRSEVLTRLVGRLQRMRSGAAEPVADFPAYVAVVAYNSCHAYFRTRFPERARLKLKLRYLVQHDSQFRLVAGSDESFLCGLAEWPDRMFERGRSSPPLPAPPSVAFDFRTSPARFVHALLRQLAKVIQLDELADLVASIAGIGGGELLSADDDRNGTSELRDSSVGADRVLESRDDLRQLWSEIELLPPRQRVALLLNLRDDNGGNALQIFPMTGVADLDTLASALDLSSDALTELWPRLPLDDLTLAERLGLTRQQIINLRKCARERLARRTVRAASGGAPRTQRKSSQSGSDRNA